MFEVYKPSGGFGASAIIYFLIGLKEALDAYREALAEDARAEYEGEDEA